MSFKVDFSKMKKIHSDKDHTIMQHPDGHEVRIAHKALSKPLRTQLHKLPFAEGGNVVKQEPDAASAFVKGFKKSFALSDSQQDQKSKPKPSPTPQQKADGGEVESKNNRPLEIERIKEEPLEIEEIKEKPLEIEAIPPKKAKHPVDYEPIKPVKRYAEGTPNVSASSDDQPFGIDDQPYGTPPSAKPVPFQMQPPKPGESATVNIPGVTPEAQQEAPQPEPQPEPMAAVEEERPVAEAKPFEPEYLHGVQTEMAGFSGAAKAEADRAKELDRILGQKAAAQQEMTDNYNKHFNEIDSERKAFQQDVLDQHIDPNRYLGSMDTGQRIGTAIALALGGLGAGLTGGPNQALSFLNSQIDRDIDAQKAELGKKETLLSANLKRFGNLREATEMTRLMMVDQTKLLTDQIASRASGPMAQARAMQLKGQLEQQAAPQAMMLAVRKAAMSGLQSGRNVEETLQSLRVVNPEMAKEMESRYVPGVGMASIPVPAEDRRNIIAKQALGKMAQDFYDWASKHSGSLSPSDINVGRAKAAELQSLYRNAINGGVFKKGEQEFIDQIIDSDPTKFFNSIRVLPKLKEVIDSNRQQTNVLHKSFGLPELTAPAEIKTMGGVRYQKVPGGWQKIQ